MIESFSLNDAWLSLPESGRADVTIDAELFLDLVQAAGWVRVFRNEIDMSAVVDANAIDYLAADAEAIIERALIWIEHSWPLEKVTAPSDSDLLSDTAPSTE